RERLGELEPLAVRPTERFRPLIHPPPEPGELQPLARLLLGALAFALATAGAEERGDRDVLQHRQPGKRLHHLERATDAEARAFIGRQVLDPAALEDDLPRRREQRAADQADD